VRRPTYCKYTPSNAEEPGTAHQADPERELREWLGMKQAGEGRHNERPFETGGEKLNPAVPVRM
jgi:hypothetical protein